MRINPYLLKLDLFKAMAIAFAPNLLQYSTLEIFMGWALFSIRIDNLRDKDNR